MKMQIYRRLHNFIWHSLVVRRRIHRLALVVAVGPSFVVADEPASFDTLRAEYERDVRHLLKRF